MVSPYTPNILDSSGVIPSINAGEVLRIQTELVKYGQPAKPQLVDIDSPILCIQKNEDGTFDAWNWSGEQQTDVPWTARHAHSAEQDPLHIATTAPTPSPVPAPPFNIGGGGGDLQSYMLGSYWLTALETIEAARDRPATTILTDTDPTALQTAITAASPGDCIEVDTDTTYDPIVIPAAKELIIRAAQNRSPALSGQYALQLTDGATNLIFAGFRFIDCSTANQNAKGAAVSFLADGAKVKDIHFDRCSFEEVQNGSAVLLSYHIAAYASPPQQDELSENISFVECTTNLACKESIEGAALSLRAVKRAFFYKCDLDGDNYNPGSRGIQLQNCPQFLIFDCESYQHSNGNGEAIKIDTIGSPVAVIPSGHVIKSIGRHSIEGIDIDDNAAVTVIDCSCYSNSNEGISVDNDSSALLLNNRCYLNDTGILLENGSQAILQNNHCYGNITNNYNILSGYTLPGSNLDGLSVPKDPHSAEKQQSILPRYNLEGNPTGEMHTDDEPTETIITTIDQWEEVTLSVVGGVQDRILFRETPGPVPPATARLKVGIDGEYQVIYSASLASTAANQTFEHGISINGQAPLRKTITRRRYSSADIGVIAGSAILDLKASDEISFVVRNRTSTSNITIPLLNVQLHKI